MIPKRFIRIWLDEEVPEAFEANWRTFQGLHPDWEFMTLDDSSKLDWMRCKDVFDASETHAGRSDALRYAALWEFGGVYVDSDVECLRPFDDLLSEPFIAWENDRLLCPTVIGAPAYHPAVGDLLDNLPAWFDAHPNATPNIASGPDFITPRWRERDDIKRLPPMAFYPVGWWEKQLLNQIDYPAEAYAVHHWAKGWAKTPPTQVRSAPGATVSVLVAFRDTEGQRGEQWAFVRERLEREYPEAEIVVASDDGQEPFHKTLALNRAAREATGDVFVVYDADTIVGIEGLHKSVDAVALHPDRWAQPYRTKIKLLEGPTREILDAGESWDGTVDYRGRMENRTTFWAAPPLVVHRQAWETVGGQEERVVGWGQEDLIFATALNVLVGRPLPKQRLGDAFHLWHPRIGVSGNDLWVGQTQEQHVANIALWGRYRAARSQDEMRALISERMVTV
jgi:hypothetical protein